MTTNSSDMDAAGIAIADKASMPNNVTGDVGVHFFFRGEGTMTTGGRVVGGGAFMVMENDDLGSSLLGGRDGRSCVQWVRVWCARSLHRAPGAGSTAAAWMCACGWMCATLPGGWVVVRREACTGGQVLALRLPDVCPLQPELYAPKTKN